MLKIRFFRKEKDYTESMNDVIKRIQNGDEALREKFIRDFIPFIIKNISQFSGKYVEVENCDEYSIGLSAFNEAINSFNETMRTSFLKFSRQVIRRRLINYVNKNEKSKKTFPFTYFEEYESQDFEEKYLSIDSHEQFKSIEINEQMSLFENKLKEFDISFTDLVLNSPKHKDTKVSSIEVARLLSQNNELFHKLLRKKKIPMVDLLKYTDISKKTIERNRKFIIAVTLILKGQFDVLNEFIKDAGKGGESFD
ncbi:MAG: RNA polymerase sigma-I factor [Clostridia bacterium]|nr:RNA polymerase sigma-I factor [Clostridia bacterium]